MTSSAVAERPSPLRTDGLLIGGRWCAPVAPAADTPVHDPATGRVVGHVPTAGPADVNLAVIAAQDAGRHWGSTSPEFRARVLDEIADRMAARRDEFAALITAEMGAPHDNARDVQTQLAIDVFRSYAAVTREYSWEERIGVSVVRYEPIGVIAAMLGGLRERRVQTPS